MTTTTDAPVDRAAALGLPPVTPEDLMTLLDLRERFEEFFERAGQAWLDHQIATNPEFAYVTNKTGYFEEFDRDHLVVSYYADAWASRNYQTTEVRVPLDEFVPGYGEIRAFLNALTPPSS